MENDEVLKAIAGFRSEMKSDMAGLKGELKGDIAGLKSDMLVMEDRLREYVHDTETRIVGEFYKWARTTEARMRTTEVTIGPLIDRLGALEARLLDVERRMNT
jgi:hypothetical protein